MAYRIILRRDISSNWTQNNPVLLAGEPGYETDTGKMKMGDGESTWNNLQYFVINPTGVTGATGSNGATGPAIDLLNVASHIIPATGGVYDLGATAGYEWRDLYLSGNSIYLGGVKISSDGTNINMNSMIVGGPTGEGGVLLTAENGEINVNGLPIGSTGIIDIEYADLRFGATSGTLIPGTYYRITDFQTCYDQPDFTYDENSITTGNYKQAEVDPIIVFASSDSQIDEIAYQPSYPNDQIKYDITYSQTEVTGGTAYGRISERIDNYNNRTDYDHRTILFKRYRLYTHRQDQPLNGTIELLEDGTVNGTNTSFTELSVGNVIYLPNINPSFYEITEITDDFEMGVTGDTIASGNGLQFYRAIEENNGNANNYFSFKRTNVKTNDFLEYTTFGDAISNDYAKNTYVGNFANNYQNVGSGVFLLANNVFLEGQYESNKFGDYCFNNTFGTDNQNNTWGDYCYENVSTNDIDGNIIGHYFYRNLINVNLVNNIIGAEFHDNELLAENNDNFEDNLIGNNFRNNLIYSRFYKNEILDEFNNNTIGDFGNLTNFEFYRNYIRNNFNDNIIRRDFQNNQIGTNFQGNTINGEFIGNTILNGYNNNEIGDYFSVNNIGNAFNNNTIYDNFQYNTTDYYFNSNVISNNFYNNSVGTYFYNNDPTNLNLFSWNNTNIENLTERNYDTFNNSLYENINSFILGKELIMHDTVNDEYHKVKFTQWTQDFNGGGFSYERTKVYPTVEPTVYFTRTNGGPEVDIIVEGSLEITRGNNGAIYNQADEANWNPNQSPIGTEWNSIYTQSNNGERFYYNKIGHNFQDNTIGSYFGRDDDNSQENGNRIGDNFRDNTVVSTMYGNVIGNYFNNNTTYSRFYNNQIGNKFENNTITDFGNLDNFEFYDNVIGNDFSQNTIRQNFNDNKIGNAFRVNVVNGNFYGNFIGNSFDNNLNIGFNFRGNHIGNGFEDNELIGDYFEDNQIGNYFYSNGVSYFFRNNQIGNTFENNTLGNADYFNWNNTTIENLTLRAYNTFNNSLYGDGGQNIDNVILGKELIMHDTVNDEYHKVKFTQWTQDNGGGFSYERTKVYPTVESTVVFTKTNYGNEVDIIVEGSLEITRGDSGAIYNQADEENWNENQSPLGTEWNSIYTQSDNGSGFTDNVIDKEFKGNLILNEFQANYIKSYVGGNEFMDSAYTNQIGSLTFDNQFLGVVFNNSWNVNFSQNTIGDGFYGNTLGSNFSDNTIANDFQNNQIGNNFNTNTIGDGFGYGASSPQGNKIGDNFSENTIYEYFYNNSIPDNFYNNTIGNYFQWNVVNTNIDGIDFTPNYGNITGFTYTATGVSATDDTYTGLSGSTNGDGVNATFDVGVSGGIVTDVVGNTGGKLYIIGNTITIPAASIGGVTGGIDTTTSDALGKIGSNGIYAGLTASSVSSAGSGATYTVGVNGILVTDFSIVSRGQNYSTFDMLTIEGSKFGGTDGIDDISIEVTSTYSDNITIGVTGVSPNPSVYESYTCQIFERQGGTSGTKRLSFYDENDILTITNINE